jgi:adenylate cyclase
MVHSETSFETHLSREMVHSEQLRVTILAASFALIAAMVAAFTWIFRDSPVPFLRSPDALRGILHAMGGLIAYELWVRFMLGQMMRRGKAPPAALRYLNALIETSLPSLLVVMLTREFEPPAVLLGPVVFLYAVFIVLSTLRLDFWLSAFTGLVAAAEFAALSFHYGTDSASVFARMSAPNFVLAKATVLLLCGVVAGLVALQLRRRISRVFRALQERARIVSAFGQQVSPQIVEELLRQGSEIASRRSFVCVMFMDIRNFTPLVESKAPEEIVAFQNAVFGEAIEVVNRHHGIINQFLGDGFMASFGAPVSAGNDCRNALNAARELVAAIRVLGEQGRIPPISIGIGLHAGDAVSGNIGSALRQQYSITGNVVILASRIEQLNKEYGSQLLVSREVLDAAGEEPAGAASLGEVHVKGREQPIELFRLA